MRFPYWDGRRTVDAKRPAQAARAEDPFDRIETAAERLGRRMHWEQGNRIGLLRLHAAIGILSGSQMLLFGGAGVIEKTLGLWTRPLLGLLGLVGGFVLTFGLLSRPRSIIAEAIGLTMIACWDFLMAFGLAFARVSIGDFQILPLDQPLPPPTVPYVPPYAISVYAGLFGLVLVHLWTLRKFKKSQTPFGDVR